MAPDTPWMSQREEYLTVIQEFLDQQKGAWDMTYTVWLDEISKDDIALAGGKGANLGELSHAGLPVPPGFVVTTAA